MIAKITSWVILGGVAAWIVWDVVVLIIEGYDSTSFITTKVREWTKHFPWIWIVVGAVLWHFSGGG